MSIPTGGLREDAQYVARPGPCSPRRRGPGPPAPPASPARPAGGGPARARAFPPRARDAAPAGDRAAARAARDDHQSDSGLPDPGGGTAVADAGAIAAAHHPARQAGRRSDGGPRPGGRAVGGGARGEAFTPHLADPDQERVIGRAAGEARRGAGPGHAVAISRWPPCSAAAPRAITGAPARTRVPRPRPRRARSRAPAGP